MSTIHKALDWRAYDRTWDMNARSRTIFRKGLLEGSGFFETSVSPPTSGEIYIQAFIGMSAQGVVMWTTTLHNLAIANGTYAVYLYHERGETSSGNTPQFITVANADIASFESSDARAPYTICFGKVEMASGILQSVDYTKRESTSKLKHSQNHGLVSAVPAIGGSVTNSVGDTVYYNDLKDGDILLTASGNTYYVQIFDASSGSFRIITAHELSSEDKAVWGTGSNQVTADGTQGELKAASVNANELGAFNSSIGAVSFRSVNLGGGFYYSTLYPDRDNVSWLGQPSNFWLWALATNIKTKTITPKDSSSTIGTDNHSAQNFNAYINTLKAKTLVGLDPALHLRLSDHLIPSVGNAYDLGDATGDYYRKAYIKDLTVDNLNALNGTSLTINNPINLSTGQIFSTGMIIAFYGDISGTPPTGWLWCDGATILPAYTALIAIVGPTTPDLQGRVLMGMGTKGAYTYALNATGGNETHQLTTAELASHNHSVGTISATASNDSKHIHIVLGRKNGTHENSIAYRGDSSKSAGTGYTGNPSNTAGGEHTHVMSGSTASSGSDTAHENRQPYRALAYIIKI